MTKNAMINRPGQRRLVRASMLAALCSASALAAPLHAQITVQPPATPPGMPQMSQTERDQINAQALLTSALQRIGTNGNDVNALIDAGSAALVLEDARSAYGFFNRALSLAPSNGRIRAGLGSALVRLENPADALKMFDQAVQQGAIERTFIADRGMAYDLMGDNARAQRDYDAALKYQYSDRTLRFYALSLGISGEADRAVQLLAPLLQKKDRAAWRDRAFILAMNGRTKEATEIVRTTMPANVANGLTPYLLKMNRLSNRQMALAVHYGQFPTSDAQLASVGRGATPAPAAAPARPAATATRTKASTPRFVDEQGRPVRLSRAEQRELIRQQEEKKKAEAAKAAQDERDRVAALARQQEQARQAEAARKAEEARQAQLALEQSRQAEAARRAELARQAEANRQAEQARQAEVARLAELQRQKMQAEEAARAAAAQSTPAAPVQTAMATPVLPPVVAAATPQAPVSAPVPSTAAPAAAPAGPALIGPVDAATPAPAGAMVQPVAVPASTATASAGVTPAAPSANVPSPPAAENSFKAFSLDDLVKSVQPPGDDPVRSETPVDLATLEKLRQDKIRAERAEAAREAAARAKAEEEKKQLAEAKAKREAEAAKAKEEADRKKANPARVWVQLATGGAAGLAGDYRRFSGGKNAELFKGKGAYSADWGRSKRLLTGPFPNVREANAWLAKYKGNGGDGFVWNSGAGEEVSAIGGR